MGNHRKVLEFLRHLRTHTIRYWEHSVADQASRQHTIANFIDKVEFNKLLKDKTSI